MYFDHPLLDDNSGLVITETGCQTLNGQQALAFARSRHLRYSDGLEWIDDPSGDLGRISRQQFFMRRMMDQVAKKAFSDPLVTNDLISVAQEYIKLDDDSEITKVVAMGQRMGQFEGDSIKSWTLPTTAFTTDGGAAVLKLDPAGAQPVIDRFRGLAVDDATTDGTGTEDGRGGHGHDRRRPRSRLGQLRGRERQRGQGPGRRGPEGVRGPRLRRHRRPRPRLQRGPHRGPLHARARCRPPTRSSATSRSGAELVEDRTLATDKVVLVTGTDFTTISRTARERTIEIDASEQGGTSSSSSLLVVLLVGVVLDPRFVGRAVARPPRSRTRTSPPPTTAPRRSGSSRASRPRASSANDDRRCSSGEADCATLTRPALVAQGIEHRPPEACARVRIAPRAPGSGGGGGGDHRRLGRAGGPSRGTRLAGAANGLRGWRCRSVRSTDHADDDVA